MVRVVRVMAVMVVEGVHDAVGSTTNTAAEGVVVTVVVVVAHFARSSLRLRLVNLKRGRSRVVEARTRRRASTGRS